MPPEHWNITTEDIEQGRCVCPTTGQVYQPLSYKTERVGTHTFAWIYCSLCDTRRRTRGDVDFDPLFPQAHAYELV